MDCNPARSRNLTDWIETCPDHSWPLAEQAREWMLTWEPDLTESIKWNMLCYTGVKLVCGLSGCKKHLGITFFRGNDLPDPAGLLASGAGTVNIRTCRIFTLEGFNVEALRALVHAAAAMDADPESPPAARTRRPELPVPEVLAEALKKDPPAATGFDRLSPTCRREYIVWVSSARRPETLARRLAETLAAVRANKVWTRRKEVPVGKGRK